MTNAIRGHWANVLQNDQSFYLKTMSGYWGGNIADYEGKQICLSVDVEDTLLGAALIDVLASSRFVLPAPQSDIVLHPEVEFDMALFDHKEVALRYEEWVAGLSPESWVSRQGQHG